MKLEISSLVVFCLLYWQVLAVDWYIASNGSTDITECGVSIDKPCASLQMILNSTASITTSAVEGYSCYEPESDDDSHNFYFIGGRKIEIVPVCLVSWSSIAITGIGEVDIDSYLSITRGIIEIHNSTQITISNINFITSFVGKATLFIAGSTQLHIHKCTLALHATSSNGILLTNMYGNSTISNTVFKGNSILVKVFQLQPSAALKINQGESMDNDVAYSYEVPLEPFYIAVDNCSFDELVTTASTNRREIDSYDTVSSNGQAILVQFRGPTNGNYLTISHCSFRNTLVLDGSTAIIRFNHNCFNNTAIFTNCVFEDNKSRYGGGVAAYFLLYSELNHFQVTNCTFKGNEATFEGGGVFVASTVPVSNNEVFIENSWFISNTGQYGSGLFVFNYPNLYDSNVTNSIVMSNLIRVEMSNCHFMECSSALSEGVVNILTTYFTVKGNNTFAHNNGSAIVLRSSLMVASGELLFTYNKAEKGGALKIFDQSAVDFSKIDQVNFTFNQAQYSGGAIFADSASTTVTADVYNHTLAAGNVAGLCFIQFPLNSESLIYFSNNSALTYGNDYSVYNVRSCRRGYLYSNFLRQFVPNINSNPVVIETDTPLLTTSSGPSYLFFYGCSSKCYKSVGNIIYKLPNCSHQLLMDNFYSLSELVCGVNEVINGFQPLEGLGGTFHPTRDRLILPWSGIGIAWTNNFESQLSSANCEEQIPGGLIISPAPGEMFDLTVQLADQLLNIITDTVYLQVNYQPEVPPGVLLQLNGIQHAYTERIYFTPNRALTGLALVGLPGTAGKLNIVSESQILGDEIVLQISFILAGCPLGYFNPTGATSINEVNHLILTKYRSTQRIPHDQPLACQCYKDSNVQYSEAVKFYKSMCISGYTVELNSAIWGGLIPINGSSIQELPTVPCFNISNASNILLDAFSANIYAARKKQMEVLGITEDPNTNPVDVARYYQGKVVPGGGAPVKCYANYSIRELVDFRPNGEFSVDVCLRDFCRGNSQTYWYLSDVDYPCVTNREGTLCGQCKPGFSQTLTSTVCRDCSHPRWYIPLATTLVIGLLLVLVVIIFNIGVSPTLDSLLFFSQTIYIVVVGRSDYTSFEFFSIFNLDFTFDQCITADLKALMRLLLQYITPLYIILLLSSVVALTKVKGFAKYLGNHSILHALWLITLVSYLNLSNSTFEILHCHYIGPKKTGSSKLVLVYDANVTCWSGTHLGWAIITVLLAAIFIIPFPFYLVLAIKLPKLKPITDVYTRIYKDSQRYWVFWNIMRRILIVLLSVFIVNFVYRHFSLLLASLLISVIFVTTRPYHHTLDNFYGCLVSFGITFFCVVTQPLSYLYFDPYRAISWSIVSIVLFIGIALLILEGVIEISKRRGGKYKSKEEVCKYLIEWLFKWKEKFNTSKSPYVELTESTTDYYGVQSRQVYSEYREPLIDSVQYAPSTVKSTSVRVSDESNHVASNSGSSGPKNATSSVVSILTNSTV